MSLSDSETSSFHWCQRIGFFVFWPPSGYLLLENYKYQETKMFDTVISSLISILIGVQYVLCKYVLTSLVSMEIVVSRPPIILRKFFIFVRLWRKSFTNHNHLYQLKLWVDKGGPPREGREGNQRKRTENASEGFWYRWWSLNMTWRYHRRLKINGGCLVGRIVQGIGSGILSNQTPPFAMWIPAGNG